MRPALPSRRPLVLDGGLATQLERQGEDLSSALWSAAVLRSHPEAITQAHTAFFAAGAEVATTATYQLTELSLARSGLDVAEFLPLVRTAVHAARVAREDAGAGWVVGSVGPYGAFLADGSEYRGDYGLSVAELMAWHRPRMAVLAAAGADLFALETIPCLAEVEALAALLAEFPHMPAWLACSCRDGASLSSGEPMAAAARIAAQTGQIVAVGVNCTAPRFVEDLLAAARGGTAKPLLCYPNSGEAWDATARCWVEGSGVTGFAEPARRWVAAGARLIGGCCRTTPEDIAVIAQALRAPGPR